MEPKPPIVTLEELELAVQQGVTLAIEERTAAPTASYAIGEPILTGRMAEP